MGQRHQAYAIYKDNSDGEEQTKVVGIHHQWLYGRTALLQLKNLLTYHEKSGDYGAFRKSNYDAQGALAAAYSFNAAEGYYHQTHTLDVETKDPRKGDNNDGITIVDFRGERPSYCFMSLGVGDSTIRKAKAFEPLTAEQYVRLYYYPGCYSYSKCDWKPEDIAAVEKEIAELLAFLAGFDVMSAEKVQAQFPMLKASVRRKKPVEIGAV